MGNLSGRQDGDHHPEDSLAAHPRPSPALSSTASPPSEPSSMEPKASKRKEDSDDPQALMEKVFGDRGVPMVFRWDGGGDEVFITGTFNNWAAKIPMSRSGNDFVHIHELSRGKHAYKFIVDDEWRFTPDQHTMADKAGNINNFLDLSEFRPKFENLPELTASSMSKCFDESMYGNRIPDINEYTREPPQLPQQLRSIVLNHRSGIPQHVTLDHLYCTARKDGLMVLGMSQRFRHKFVTTVYYSPVNGGFPGLVSGKRSSSASASVGASSGGIPSASRTAGSVGVSASATTGSGSSTGILGRRM